MQEPLILNPKPSRWFKLLCLSQYAGAIGCSGWALLPEKTGIFLAVLTLIIGHCFYFILSKTSKNVCPQQIIVKPSGKIDLFFNQTNQKTNPTRKQGILLPTLTYRGKYLTILAVRVFSAKTLFIPLFCDSLPDFAYRRLLAQLRAIAL